MILWPPSLAQTHEEPSGREENPKRATARNYDLVLGYYDSNLGELFFNHVLYGRLVVRSLRIQAR